MKSKTSIPTLLTHHIPAGLGREIESHFERIDLNKMLAGDNDLLLHVEGDSMDNVVCNDDWIILSREREPKPNDVVVARLNGEYSIKRHKLKHKGRNGLFLVPANGSYKTTEVTEQDDYEILGVVVYIIKKP